VSESEGRVEEKTKKLAMDGAVGLDTSKQGQVAESSHSPPTKTSAGQRRHNNLSELLCCLSE